MPPPAFHVECRNHTGRTAGRTGGDDCLHWSSPRFTRFRRDAADFHEIQGIPDILPNYAAPHHFAALHVAIRQAHAKGLAPNKFNRLGLDQRQNPAYKEPARSEVRFFCSLCMRFRCQQIEIPPAENPQPGASPTFLFFWDSSNGYRYCEMV